MSADGPDRDAGGRRLLAGYVTRLLLATSFLTIMPLGPRNAASEDDLAGSFGLFPLVGFIIGEALALEDFMLATLFGIAIRSGLIVMTLVIVTGGLHLDALADTADALGAGPIASAPCVSCVIPALACSA